MDRIIRVRVEKLPEGIWLATSDEVQGLVAQGRTVNEALATARDIVRWLMAPGAARRGGIRPDRKKRFRLSPRRFGMTGPMAGLRCRDVARRLRQLGFRFDRQATGSAEIWFAPTTRRYTTIPSHPGDLPYGTLRAILAQAGVSLGEFLADR